MTQRRLKDYLLSVINLPLPLICSGRVILPAEKKKTQQEVHHYILSTTKKIILLILKILLILYH